MMGKYYLFKPPVFIKFINQMQRKFSSQRHIKSWHKRPQLNISNSLQNIQHLLNKIRNKENNHQTPPSRYVSEHPR
jgi:hypothetical protein